MKKIEKCLPSLILVLVLLVSMIGGAAYAKYVTDKNLSGSITINAHLGNIEIWESTVSYDAKTGYTLDAPAQKSSSNYSYTVIPGLDVPKDPVVHITDKSTIEVYVFLEVKTNIKNDPKGISYTINDDWILIDGLTGANGGAVYYYKETVTDADGIGDIPILEDNLLHVSQYLKQATDAEGNSLYPSGSVYLNFTANMYQAAAGASAREVYQHYNP